MTRTAGYGTEHELVDYIHGITYEIWEQRGVELIGDYYGAQMPLYTLGGVIRGAQAVIDNTWATLAAYPDRRLLAEAVITSGTVSAGFSSHRIFSPMTNLGASNWGPATGRQVTVRTIADCRVEDGRIVEEWLARDNAELASQLGLALPTLARSQRPDADARAWQQTQIARVRSEAGAQTDFCHDVLRLYWTGRSDADREVLITPYAVRHLDTQHSVSGREAVIESYREEVAAFSDVVIAVDQVTRQRWAGSGEEYAVRYSLAATHTGTYLGIAATQRPVYVMGIAHWRLVAGRLATQWDVVDRLALLAQLV
ncbi:MAG: ester cyclase [Pseudomonadota bacterium]